MSEEEIREEYAVVERAKRDPQAFGFLYDKYFNRIFGFIYRQTDDEDVAADLTSQTFLNALNHLKQFEFRGVPVSAWLYRIAGNEVNKYYRKKKKSKIFTIEEEKMMGLIDTPDEKVDDDLIQRLIEYLKELPTEMLEVLQLRFFEDRDFKEIAFILNITESGAKMRTYRALDRLRRNFNLKIRYDG